ncbi:LMF2 factor, partial [Amia calva]|nr:LMF2 factor [Amia calva]
MGEIQLPRRLFLWSMSVIYMFAFASLYIQIPGLYGNEGILPARWLMRYTGKPMLEQLKDSPTLLWLGPMLGLDTQQGMELICLLGTLLAFGAMVLEPMRDSLIFFCLWALYLSLYQVGQVFLYFQWDSLLLEVGFLTILVAPLNLFRWKQGLKHHDGITFWLLRWLLFRLMFASGVVKLTSRCPTWWGLTALTYHYETQCIPTPLAWYAHQAPVWFQKLSVVGTYVIEIAVPFLFFLPIRSMRILSFYLQVLLQICILLTGNYNFFNLLTIALCFSLLDDEHIHVWHGQCKKKKSKSFTYHEFNQWLKMITGPTIWIGVLSLTWEIVTAMFKCACVRGFFWKLWSTVQWAIFASAAAGMFAISLVPYTFIEYDANSKIWPGIKRVYDDVDRFQLVNSYGLFRRMTGVGGRPEVVLEGSFDKETWTEIEFMYKPGNVSGPPPVVAPHQPRLDWQMWFAALGPQAHSPWFTGLVHRLLQGKKDVISLIQTDESQYPFSQNPPVFIRAQLYKYWFIDDVSQTKQWWRRQFIEEFYPTVFLGDPNLEALLSQHGLKDKGPAKRSTEAFVPATLKCIREHVGPLTGPQVLLSLFVTGLAICVLKGLFGRAPRASKPKPAVAENKTRKAKDVPVAAEKKDHGKKKDVSGSTNEEKEITEEKPMDSEKSTKRRK